MRLVIILVIFALTAAGVGFAQSQEDDGKAARPRRVLSSGAKLTMQDVRLIERAIESNKRLVRFSGFNFEPYYNLASQYAMLGHKEDTLEWLRKAVDKGFIDSDLISADPNFEGLRAEAAFKEIVAASAEKAAKLAKLDQKIVFIAGPKSPKKNLPLFIVLHGETENAFNALDLWRGISEEREVVVAAPQGKYMVADGHFQWGRRADTEPLVLAAIDQAKAKYSIDTNRIYIMGFSQGGYLSLLLGLTRPDLFAGAIGISSRYIHAQVEPGLDKVKARNFRVYLGNGENDDPNLISASREAKRQLEAAGLKVDHKIYPETGHALPPNVIDEMKKAADFLLAK